MSLAKKNNTLVNIRRHRLDERLTYMKSVALSMGACVEDTLSDTKSILLQKSEVKDIIEKMRQREDKVNELQVKLSKFCFRSLARQAPVAKDLRMVLTVLGASTDLERMGDLAINIAHRFQKLKSHPSLKRSYSLLEDMFDSTNKMVRATLDAFVKEDVALSKKVLEMDDIVDASLTSLRKESKTVMSKDKELISACVDFIIIGGHLERIADHATNIAEEVIFLETGKDIRHT